MAKRSCLTCGALTTTSYCPTHQPYRGDWAQRSKAQRRRVNRCECQGCPACTTTPAGCADRDLCADHITNGEQALQTLCRACNSSKR